MAEDAVHRKRPTSFFRLGGWVRWAACLRHLSGDFLDRAGFSQVLISGKGGASPLRRRFVDGWRQPPAAADSLMKMPADPTPIRAANSEVVIFCGGSPVAGK